MPKRDRRDDNGGSGSGPSSGGGAPRTNSSPAGGSGGSGGGNTSGAKNSGSNGGGGGGHKGGSKGKSHTALSSSSASLAALQEPSRPLPIPDATPVIAAVRDSGRQPPPTVSGTDPPSGSTAPAVSTPSNSKTPLSPELRAELQLRLRRKCLKLKGGYRKAIVHLPPDLRTALENLTHAGRIPMRFPLDCLGIRGEGLADTGAGRAIVSSAFVARLPADKRPEIKPLDKAEPLQSFGGIVNAIGTIKLPIKLAASVRGHALDLPQRTMSFLVLDEHATAVADVVFDESMVKDPDNVVGFLFHAAFQLGLDVAIQPRAHRAATVAALSHTAMPRPGDLTDARSLLPVDLVMEEIDPLPPEPPSKPLSEADLRAELHVSEDFGAEARKATIASAFQRRVVFGPLPPQPCLLDPLEIHFKDRNVRPYDCGHPYSVNRHKLEATCEGITDDLESGRFKRSQSPWGFQNVIVAKRSSRKVRRCADYSKLNVLVERDLCHFQPLSEIIDSVQGCTHFSVIDTRTGYQQLGLAPGVGAILAENTIMGKIEPTRAPFGFIGSGDAFYRGLRNAFATLIDKRILFIYGDDILIATKGAWQDHLAALNSVFDIADEKRLRLNAAKCHLMQSAVPYCGLIVDGKSRRIDPERLQGLRDYPVPQDRKHLMAFLGLVNYYSDFVRDYLRIIAPLRQAFRYSEGKPLKQFWTPECDAACAEIKQAIILAAPLLIANFDRPFILKTDASGIGLGAALSQIDPTDGIEKPVAFASRAFAPGESLWNTTEKECMAFIHALDKWGNYLRPRRFVWRTDHNNLLWMNNSTNPKVRRWAVRAAEYEFDTEHIPGVDNVVCDALSRDPPAASVEDFRMSPAAALSAVAPVSTGSVTTVLAAVSSADVPPARKQLYSDIAKAQAEADEDEREQWTAENGYSQAKLGDVTLFLWHGDIVLPTNADDLRTQLLRTAHDEMAHGGTRRTLARLKEARVSWPSMRASVTKYVDSCVRCKLGKAPVGPSASGYMQGLQESRPFSRIQMDWEGPFPVTKAGNSYLLTVTDSFTRWTFFRAAAHADAAAGIRLLDEVIRDYGPPSVLQTDNGKHFDNRWVDAWCAKHHVTHHPTMVYHPQSNGKVERLHRVTSEALRTIYGPQHTNDWDVDLDNIAYSINTAVCRSIGCSPFRALRGFDAPTKLTQLLGTVQHVPTVSDLQRRIEATHAFVRVQQQAAFETSKADYDAKHTPISYAVGSKVLVHYPSRDNKLCSYYRGPFTVAEKLNDNAYRVKDIHGKLSDVHIVRIRLLDSSRLTKEDEEALWTDDGEYLVEAVREHRKEKDGTLSFLIKWYGYSEDENTWAPYDRVSHLAELQLYVENNRLQPGLREAPLHAKRQSRKVRS